MVVLSQLVVGVVLSVVRVGGHPLEMLEGEEGGCTINPPSWRRLPLRDVPYEILAHVRGRDWPATAATLEAKYLTSASAARPPPDNHCTPRSKVPSSTVPGFPKGPH